MPPSWRMVVRGAILEDGSVCTVLLKVKKLCEEARVALLGRISLNSNSKCTTNIIMFCCICQDHYVSCHLLVHQQDSCVLFLFVLFPAHTRN